MRRLILMRHGEAPNSMCGKERELNQNGNREVEITASHIKSCYKIGHVLCSSAKRNRQTLEILQHSGAVDAYVEFSDDIYQNDLAILQSLISDITSDAKTILLLGHNPSLLTLALSFDSDGYDKWVHQIGYDMRTAEIIVIEFENAENWYEVMNSPGKIKDIFIPC